MDRSCRSGSELSEWIGAVRVNRSCLSVIKTDSWFSDSSDYSDSSDVSDPLRQLRNTDYVKHYIEYVKRIRVMVST